MQMNWSYRAVQRQTDVAVYAVYRNGDGDFTSSDSEPYTAVATTVEELIERLTLIVEELKEHPPISLPWETQDGGI